MQFAGGLRLTNMDDNSKLVLGCVSLIVSLICLIMIIKHKKTKLENEYGYDIFQIKLNLIIGLIGSLLIGIVIFYNYFK